MATILKQKSGRWRVQVRRKGRYLSETFSLRKDAEAWARRIERDLDVVCVEADGGDIGTLLAARKSGR